MQTPLESILGAVCQNPSVRFGTPAAQLSARWCRMSLPDLEGKNTSSPLKDYEGFLAIGCLRLLWSFQSTKLIDAEMKDHETLPVAFHIQDWHSKTKD